MTMPYNTNLPLDEESAAKLKHLTAIYESLDTALSILGDCREKFLAITNLEQSHMWLIRTIEREQLERNFSKNTAASKKEVAPPPTTELSPSAAVLADSREKLDSLMQSIKDLTSTVAIKGFPPINKG